MTKQHGSFFLFFLLMLISSTSLFAQADLSAVKDKIIGEEFEEAKKELTAMLATDPKNVDEVYYWLGKLEYDEDDYASAKSYFEKGLAVRSKSALCTAGLGLVTAREGKTDEAKAMLESAFAISKGKDPDVLLAIADGYLVCGGANIATAKTYLYKLRDDYPNDPRAFIALGKYYKAQNVPELAQEEFERALKLQPDYVPALVAMAELKYEAGREAAKKGESSASFYQTGFEFANKAVQLRPEFAPAYKIRGELLLLAKEITRARDDYQKYVQLTQNDVNARIRYASFLFLAENYDQALAELKKLESEGVSNNLMLRLEGLALLKTGKVEEAKTAMERYFDKVKPEYRINEDYEAYGDILREEGSLDEADKNYDKAIELNPFRNAKWEEIANEYGNMAKEAVKAKADADSISNLYGLQARYLKKFIGSKEGEALKDYYLLGQAQYYSKSFEDAYAAFSKVIELKDDFVTGYLWQLRAGDQIEKADSTQKFKYTVPTAQNIVRVAEAASIDKSNKSAYVTSLVILAYNEYLLSPTDAAMGCQKAKPYIEKLVAVDPENAEIKNLSEACAQYK